MSVDVRKATIEGRMYDVISPEDFVPKSGGNVAVHYGDLLYPERNKGDEKPGVYSYNWGSITKNPSAEELEEYSASKVIDFNNLTTIRDYIDKNTDLKSSERGILTMNNPDNLTIPPLLETDTPEMRLFKEATAAKKMEIENYQHRFAGRYSNDKRLFFEDSITFRKLRELASILDMKVTLTIEDQSPDVPNPIGRKMSAEITGGGNDD